MMRSAEVLRNSEEYLNGLISGYAKQVLTKLNEAVEIDTIELIKENILDLFVNDPVEGWLHHTA